MSDRAAEARAEAERRNPLPECCDGVETHCRWHRQVERLREEFDEGRRWADANPKPPTTTRSWLRDTAMMLAHTRQDEIEAMLPGLLGIEVEDDDE